MDNQENKHNTVYPENESLENEIEKNIESIAEKIEERADSFGKKIESEFKEEKKTGDVVGALFLIFIGLMLLLNSLGIVSWGIWFVILRFWPILLIFGGLQLVFGKSAFSRLIIGILAFVILGFIALVAIYNASPSLLEQFNVTIPQNIQKLISIENEAVEYNYNLEVDSENEINSRRIVASLGMGEITISDSSNKDLLVSVDSKVTSTFGEPTISDEIEDEELTVTFKQDSQIIFGTKFNTPEYMIELGSRELPTSLLLEVGAGKGEVDLDVMSVDDLSFDVGAGSIQVSLGNGVTFAEDSTIQVNVGAGELVLDLDESVDYEVDYNVGVGSVRIGDEDYSGLGKEGSVTSDDFETAENKVSIRVDVGLGSFRLK